MTTLTLTHQENGLLCGPSHLMHPSIPVAAIWQSGTHPKPNIHCLQQQQQLDKNNFRLMLHSTDWYQMLGRREGGSLSMRAHGQEMSGNKGWHMQTKCIIWDAIVMHLGWLYSAFRTHLGCIMDVLTMNYFCILRLFLHVWITWWICGHDCKKIKLLF